MKNSLNKSFNEQLDEVERIENVDIRRTIWFNNISYGDTAKLFSNSRFRKIFC